MNLILLDYNSYEELINCKSDLILGVFNKNSEDSKLYFGVLSKLSKKLKLNDIYLIEKSIYKEINKDYIDILPQTLKIKHRKVENISYGFKSTSLIEEDLKIY